MELILYDFGKRRNSTRQPPANVDVVGTYNVVLKTQTSMVNPTFILQLADINVRGNYCRCMGRYYWIDDKVQIANNIVEYQCTLDVLATYKDAVAVTNAFVEYADTGYDINVIDNRTIATGTVYQKESKLTINAFDHINGVFVVTVVGSSSSSVTGFTTCYMLNWIQMKAFANAFIQNQDIWTEIKQWALSAYDAIVSCRWLPLKENVFKGRMQTIKLGDYDTGISGMLIDNPAYTETILMQIPWQYSDYRNAPPFTTGTIFIPCIGLNPINTGDLYGSTHVKGYFTIDCITGDCVTYIYNNDTNSLVQLLSGNLSVELPIGQVASNAGAIVSGAIGTVAAVGSLVTGNVSGAALAIGATALAFNQREVCSNGNVSGRAGQIYTTDIILTIYAKGTHEPSNFIGTSGRPVGRKMTLGTMSGYVKCIDATAVCNGTANEVDMLNDYLNGGFWYE